MKTYHKNNCKTSTSKVWFKRKTHFGSFKRVYPVKNCIRFPDILPSNIFSLCKFTLWKNIFSVENDFRPIQSNFSSQFWTWHELTLLLACGFSWAKCTVKNYFWSLFCFFLRAINCLHKFHWSFSKIFCVPWNTNRNINFDQCFILRLHSYM